MALFVCRSTDNLHYEKFADGTIKCIEDEIPFEVPESWAWCRLVEVCEYIQRGKSPKYSLVERIPVIAQKCNQWDGFHIEKAKFIEPDSLKSYANERLLQDNDLMWNSTGLGSLGRIAVYQSVLNPYKLAVADSHVTIIRPLKNFILSRFLYYYFSNPSVQNIIESQADGTTKQKELATSTIKSYLIPIPSLQEQRRILDKLDKVLLWIEKYNITQNNIQILQDSLHVRLKKSILQHAVQGKLVPQDESDEPASVLLERIRAEKEELIKQGKLKKDKHGSIIFRRDNSYYERLDGVERCIDDEIPFEIPKSWVWVRLTEICTYIQRGKSPEYSPIKKYPVIAQKCIQWSGFSIESARFIKPNSLQTYAKERLLEDNDLMWNSTGLGSLGRIGIYKSNLNPFELAVADSHVTVIRPFKKAILSKYLYYYFSNPSVQNVIEDSADGSTKQKELATTTIKTYLVPIPNLLEQHRIVNKVEDLLKLIKTL